MMPDIGQAASQVGGEISRVGHDLNRFAGLAADPLIEVLGRGHHVTALAGDRHTRFFGPALRHGYWLTQEVSDGLPAL